VTFATHVVGDVAGDVILRHEVTNREFKRFVDAGAYERRELWKHPVVTDAFTTGTRFQFRLTPRG
jgi:formylglycine-generating enzyme required for sulfatase activity